MHLYPYPIWPRLSRKKMCQNKAHASKHNTMNQKCIDASDPCKWRQKQTATHHNTLQHTATHCNTHTRASTPLNTLQHTTPLRHHWTHCNSPFDTIEHTATHHTTYMRATFIGALSVQPYEHICTATHCNCSNPVIWWHVRTLTFAHVVAPMSIRWCSGMLSLSSLPARIARCAPGLLIRAQVRRRWQAMSWRCLKTHLTNRWWATTLWPTRPACC